MTAPRIPLFQRKPTEAAPDGEPTHQPTGPDESSETRNMVQCPQCGCEFDPADAPDAGSGPPPDAGSADLGADGGDLSGKIQAMMQGGG